MNINELFMKAQQLAPEVATSYCIVNGEFMTLKQIENMGYDKFSYRSKINMPLKLYKYFSNEEEKLDDGRIINYSMKALKNNTVFMQSPSLFDDVYDSDINIDFMEYQKYRLIEYCKRCGLDVDEQSSVEEIGTQFIGTIMTSYKEYGDFEHFFIKKPETQIEEMTNVIFQQRIRIELAKNSDLVQAVSKIIAEEYKEYVKNLQNTFRISCFATTPYSQLMWGLYADCHKGFCVEYTVLPDNPQYKDIFYNIFPLVYCKTRPNMTEKLVRAKDHDKTKENLWDIYLHGALRKSIDWAFQNEWRLLLPIRSKNQDDYNIDFFPITSVYLGNKMPIDKRREVIEFCNSKNISYMGVRRNPNVFEMQACEIKCENCPQYMNK
jgi:hypothetical protein